LFHLFRLPPKKFFAGICQPTVFPFESLFSLLFAGGVAYINKQMGKGAPNASNCKKAWALG
jgi:hypothetical protein